MIRVGIECESVEDDSWGVARLVRNLLEELSRRPELAAEFKFVLYFKSHVPDWSFLAGPLFEKRLMRLPLFRPSFSLYYYILLPLISWLRPVDIMFFPNYMLPIGFHGKTLVMLTDDVYTEARNPKLPLRYRLAYRIFCGWAARHANKIMTISQTSRDEVARLYKIAPYRVLVNYLGIDVPNQQTTNHKQTKRNYILYVGQAFPRRHLKECLEAFEKLASDNPELMFIAIGPDKYQPPVIRQLAHDINHRLGKKRVYYRERVEQSELAELYASAKAVLYVSDREAFGLPPLEALAYNTVPIVADTPVSHELFGDAAHYTPLPISAGSIAQTVTQAMKDEQKNNAVIGAAPGVVSRFTWKAHADRFVEIVKNIGQ